MSCVIGVDVDNTVVNSNYHWWEWLELQTKAGISWTEAKKYQQLTNVYQEFILKEEALDFWRSTYVYDRMEPIVDSVRVLKKLKDEGNKIVFISAAKGQHGKGKYLFLERHFPFMDASILTKEKEYVNVDVMIDDSNHVLNRFKDKKTALIKYENFNTQAEDLKVSADFVCSWNGVENVFDWL